MTKGKRLKVVRFLISPNKKKVKIEVNKIMNPAFLLGTAFNIAYWHRKYHSGTICKGVSNPQTSNALSGCEKEEIPKWVSVSNQLSVEKEMFFIEVLTAVIQEKNNIARSWQEIKNRERKEGEVRNQGWLNFWETKLVTERKSLHRSCWTELTCQQ